MAFKTISRALYTKVEATPGTAADPLDRGNAYANPEPIKVRVRELDVTIDPQVDDENSKYLTGDFTGDESIIGKIPGTVNYNIKFAPGQFRKDALDAANEHGLNYSEFLEGSGLNQILITDDSVAQELYSYPNKYFFFPSVLASDNTLSQTVVDKNANGVGIGYDITGSINNMTLSADGVGAPFKMQFEGAGGVNDVYEISAIDMAKIKFDGANVMRTVASKFLKTIIRITDLATGVPIEVCVNKLELSSGAGLSEVECQAAASGILYNTITSMEPRLNINPELKSLSDFDFFKALTNETFYKIEIIAQDTNAADGSAFEPIKVVIPRAQMLSAPISDDNGFLRNDITFRPLGNIDKDVPVVQYAADVDGTLTDFDFAGTSLEGSEQEMTYAIIISEEYLADI